MWRPRTDPVARVWLCERTLMARAVMQGPPFVRMREEVAELE
jgi:hypothetical protein